MRRSHVPLVSLTLVGALLLFVAPASAQAVNRDLFDRLNTQLLYVALPLTVFVEIILVYAVLRFKDNPDPKPTIADPPLEITWTVATAVILLFVGFSAYTVLGSPYVSPAGNVAADPGSPDAMPQDAVVVNVTAYQFGWEVHYPQTNTTTQGELVVPTDREVYLRLQSADVIHSLFIPDWGIKQDVFPGQTTLVHTRVYQPGVYRLYCAELCGVGHSRMTGNATAVSEQKYRSWLDAHRNETGVTTAPQPRTGQTPEDPVPEPPTNVSNVTNVTNVTNATS